MGFREWPSRLCRVPRQQKSWKTLHYTTQPLLQSNTNRHQPQSSYAPSVENDSETADESWLPTTGFILTDFVQIRSQYLPCNWVSDCITAFTYTITQQRVYLVSVVDNNSTVHIFALWMIDNDSWCRISTTRHTHTSNTLCHNQSHLRLSISF